MSKMKLNALLLSFLVFFLLSCEQKDNDAKKLQSMDKIANEAENINNATSDNKDNRKESVKSANQSVDDSKNVSDTTASLKSLEKQFDDLYGILHMFSLPMDESTSLEDLFTEVPKNLDSVFALHDFSYIAKLPEYKKIKVIFAVLEYPSGEQSLLLCTFLNYKNIDKLVLSSVSEGEYNGRTEATTITSFSITSNYEILIKTAFRPNTEGVEEEINVTHNTYIISDGGKFLKKEI
jgi:hypothetical protein